MTEPVKIVVLDGHTLNPGHPKGDNPWTEVEKLGDLIIHDRTYPDQLLDRARDADVLLVNKTKVPAEALTRMPRLKFVSLLATGYDCVDVQAAGRQGVTVSNVPVYGTDSVAQFVLALVLELSLHVGEHDRLVKAGAWQSQPDWCFWRTPLVELRGKTMGVVGFGRIGRRVGELAHAFGMNVLAHDVLQGQPPDYKPFAWAGLTELFAQSDYVSLNCPQTKENVGFVKAELINRMKPTAFLINAARGGLVNQDDLAAALNAGRIAGAALDVVAVEPIVADNPLLKAKNLILTPHMAWATLEARRRIMTMTAENIAAFLAGRPINVVNGAYLKK